MTAEQKARDMLERIGVPDAQSYTAGDIVELANLISMVQQLETWKAEGERLLCGDRFSSSFSLGQWWADRPWRNRR